jgi:integrase
LFCCSVKTLPASQSARLPDARRPRANERTRRTGNGFFHDEPHHPGEKAAIRKTIFPDGLEAGKVRKGFVTPEQFEKLMSKMPRHLKPYSLFLYEDVSRTTAAKDIRWSLVDLKEGIIEIPEEITKTGEAQTLPLSDELIDILKKQFRQDDAPVFDTTNFRKEFQQAAVAAGFGKITKMVSAKGYKWEKYEGVTPRDFRRSGIRNMVRAGVPFKKSP